jgi:hypothetical protein
MYSLAHSPLKKTQWMRWASRCMPEAFEEVGRGGVAIVEYGADAVQPELLETEPEHLTGSLESQPLSLVVDVQGEADLALAVGLAGPLEQYFADHRSGFAKLDREDQPLSWFGQRILGELGLEGGARLFAVPDRPGCVAHHVWPRVERVQVVQVVRPMRPQVEPLGSQGIGRAQSRHGLVLEVAVNSVGQQPSYASAPARASYLTVLSHSSA